MARDVNTLAFGVIARRSRCGHDAAWCSSGYSCRDHTLCLVSMATLTVSAPVSETTRPARTVASQRLPRWFCAGMAVAAVGVLIVGFAPSVYARLPETMPAMRAIVMAVSYTHLTLPTSDLV